MKISKAELMFENVGGLRGEHRYDFTRGKINFISGTNASGKTSILRSLAAILSIPSTGDLSSFYFKEAEKIGILKDPRNQIEGFVNIHEQIAKIILTFEEQNIKYEVRQDGSFLSLPEEGDKKFLLTGIITRNSKIPRQIFGLDTESEPDNFRWAVTQLSLASNFETFENALKTLKEDYEFKLNFASNKIKEFSDLTVKKEKLLEQKKHVDNQLKELIELNKEIEKYLEQRIKITDRIENLERATSGAKRDLDLFGIKLKNTIDKNDKLNENYEKLKDTLSKYDIKKEGEDIDKEKKEMSDKIEKLVKKRNDVDVILNLYVTAEAGLRNENQTTICPLCNQGHITYELVKTKLSDIRNNRKEYNDEIHKFNVKRNNIEYQFKERQKKYENIKKELDEIENTKRTLKREIMQNESQISSFTSLIDKNTKELAKNKRNLENIIKSIPDKYEEINKEYSNKENESMNLFAEIKKIEEQLLQNTIKLEESDISLENAIKILKVWIDKISNSIEYCTNKAEEQRKKASQEFNKNIKKFMEELGFTEFRDISITNDYRLYVERYDEKRGDYIFQQVETLSTSEKLAIVILLQMALKETYLPQVPFFLIDDIISDFDEERKDKVLKYLSEKAIQNNWYIIICQLDETLPKISITTL